MDLVRKIAAIVLKFYTFSRKWAEMFWKERKNYNFWIKQVTIIHLQSVMIGLTKLTTSARFWQFLLWVHYCWIQWSFESYSKKFQLLVASIQLLLYLKTFSWCIPCLHWVTRIKSCYRNFWSRHNWNSWIRFCWIFRLFLHHNLLRV